MSCNKWLLREENPHAEKTLTDAGLSKLAAKVLSVRGVETFEQAEQLLDSSLELIADPLLMADMAIGSTLVSDAIARGDRIAIYGDYDVDGITSVSLLVDWLRSRHADVIYHIPDRLEDGYGMSKAVIDTLAAAGAKLIVTVDLGITAIEEAKYAEMLGIRLIITDHHECREELPVASAVINPMRPDCPYPAKNLAGVGVAFMLVLAVEGFARLETLLEAYADLVAIGTIADVMHLTGTNRALVRRGLEEINRGRRIGLRALIKEAVLHDGPIGSGTIGFTIAPRINAAGRMSYAGEAVEFFLSTDPKKAQEYALHLCELNRLRQKMENDVYDEAIALAEEELRLYGKDLGVIVLTSNKWHQGIIGIIASRLSERFAHPVILISLENGIGKGSVRSFYGIDIYSSMKKAAHLFETWGGHHFAAGFTMKAENIELLRSHMRSIKQELEKPHIHIDAVIEKDLLNIQEVEGLRILEPHGAGNYAPTFLIKKMRILEVVSLGWGKSLKLIFEKDGRSYPAFYFGLKMQRLDLCEGDVSDVVCRIELLEQKGSKSIKLILLDLKPEEDEVKRFSEEMSLYQKFAAYEPIRAEEALLLMPQKTDFVAVLRYLKRNSNADGEIKARLSAMLRQICREERIERTYGRLFVCLNVLAEKNRLRYELEDGIITIVLLEEKPTDLNTSEVLIRLKSGSVE